jgi:hypothetical protein
MKAVKFIILLVALLLPTTLCAQSRIFSDLANEKNVHSVYISKVMLSLASGLVGNSIQSAANIGIDISDLVDKVNTIEVVSTDTKKGVKKIQKQLDKAVKSYDLLTLIDNPNGDNNSQLLYASDDYSGLITKLLLVKKSKSQMRVIVIQGSLDPTDLTRFK